MSDDARSRILNAAGPTFAEKGFQAATVREICEAAGVNVASINYHFGDKESLYYETLRRAREMREAQVPMPDLSGDEPAQQRLALFVKTMMTRMMGVREVTWQSRLMMREMLRPTKACAQIVEQFLKPELGLLLRILNDLLPRETPRHVRMQVAFSIVGQCLFYRVAREVVGMLVSPEDRREHFSVEELTEHVTRLTLASLGLGESVAAEFVADRLRSTA
jgi:AcrR family transcriptional regulator